MGPNACSAVATSPCTWRSSRTSHSTAIARAVPRSPWTSSTVARAPSPLTSATVTDAPSAANRRAKRAPDAGGRAGDDHVLPGDLHRRGSVLPAVGVMSRTVSVGDVLGAVLGPDLPVAFVAYDGSRCGPDDARTTVVVRSRGRAAPDRHRTRRAGVRAGLRRRRPRDRGRRLRRDRDAGSAREREGDARADRRRAEAARGQGAPAACRHRPRRHALRGRRHSKARDAAAISFHYDVSNDFYRIVLGPSLTYSCAVWTDTTTTLEQAQANKHELVSRKLGLEPGMRLLDIGCGWGGMVLHAAKEHGVRAVGVTLSKPQADLARKRAAELGVGDLVEIRHADYRDVDDGPYDAISSIGMFEHVGLTQLGEYFAPVPRAARARRAPPQPRHQPAGAHADGAPHAVRAARAQPRLHRALRVPRR